MTHSLYTITDMTQQLWNYLLLFFLYSFSRKITKQMQRMRISATTANGASERKEETGQQKQFR